MVMDIRSPHPLIVGRMWLDSIEAVSSTRHQCLRFPYHGEVVSIWGETRFNGARVRNWTICVMHIKWEMHSYKMKNYSPEDMLGQGRKPKRARDKEEAELAKPPPEMSWPTKAS
ncbi:hypothetical protein QJS04_geneDACA020811 [Acorus gramineus]|uniref:Uncharacterized protein n=1 Tax=Acorus gramineus TaxID=55184 RepID=A0AAV9BIJ8_ACOGR|nr:hypothetical protein QJS04_geneDACA020811 [Acorus gramineus]